MTQPDDLIVGKSVEEIEAETGNRVNSPVPTEDRRNDAGTVMVPAVAGQTNGGQFGGGALGGLPGIIGTELGDDGSGTGGAKGHRNHTDRTPDSSEE
ncbi:hypothetical protein [Deinococcus altitudinis]|uniref:hypothetical protein n=1 Tax=Deinococcus altitudinis TaxID=468914 RepID=UPI003892ABA9